MREWTDPLAWPRLVLLALVDGYRLLLRAWLGRDCRFEPSCSTYARQAIALHGAMAGGRLTVARLMRCHPACPGGHDPVPGQAPRLFSRLFSRLPGE